MEVKICYYYETQSIVVSFSSLFCESRHQPVVKGLTESCTVILSMMIFFSIQAPVSKSLLSPIKLFFFVPVLLSSQSPIATIYSSKPVDIAPNAPTTTEIKITSFMSHTLVISSLSTLHFSIFPASLLFTHSSPGTITSTILTFLVLSIRAISGHRASILVSHWILKSLGIFYPLFSITPSGSCSYHCCVLWKSCFLHSFQ